MNSVILSWICSIFGFLWNSLQHSRIKRLFDKLYNAVSSSVLESFTAVSFGKERSEGGSLIYKLCRLPFALIDLLSSAFHKILCNFCNKSITAETGRIYFNAFAALNTRFFGGIVLGFGGGYCIISVLSGGFSVKAIAVSIIGILLCIKNNNISDYLNTSKIISFLQTISDLKDIRFDFYEKEKALKNSSLILGLLTGILSGVLASKALLLGLALPFALFALLLVLLCPVAGLFAAVFAAPFVPTMLLAGICLLTLFSLFVNKTLIPGYKWKLNGVGTALILLLAILLVSSVLSFDMKKSIMVWAMYFVFFSFYFVIINTVETKEQLFALLKVFVIAGTFVALYGILQYIFKWDTSNAWIDEEMFEEATMRAYSTLENPNVLGEYLLLVLPISAVFMIKLRARELSKWVYAAAFAVLALCLVFTQSRGCWLGFLFSAAIFVSFYKGKLWSLLPLGLLLLPFILPQTIVDRIMSIGNMSDSSTSYRVYIWYATIEMLKVYLLGGIGMGEGAFGCVYPFYSYNAIVAPHSHNLFLQLTVEAGLGTLIVFLSAAILFFKDSVTVCKRSKKNSYEYLTALALASGVAGFLLQSMFDYTFYNYRVMSIFVMYLAFGAVLKLLSVSEGGKK